MYTFGVVVYNNDCISCNGRVLWCCFGKSPDSLALALALRNRRSILNPILGCSMILDANIEGKYRVLAMICSFDTIL